MTVRPSLANNDHFQKSYFDPFSNIFVGINQEIKENTSGIWHLSDYLLFLKFSILIAADVFKTYTLTSLGKYCHFKNFLDLIKQAECD